MDVHQRIAGVLLALMGGLTLVWSLFFAAMAFSMGSWSWMHLTSDIWWMLFFGLIVLLTMAWAFLAMRAGFCLYQGRRSRTLVPAAALALLGFPMGTFAGGYTLWSIWREGAPKAPPDWQRIAREQQVVQAQA